MREFSEKDIKLFQERVEAKRLNNGGSLWAIKVNGLMYTTSSGKCGWKQKHHAKSAFKLDNSTVVRQLEKKYGYKSYKDSLSLWHDYLAELEDQGIVEFVEIN